MDQVAPRLVQLRRADLTQGAINEIQMPLHKYGEGILRLVAREGAEQIQIVCTHSHQHIATEFRDRTRFFWRSKLSP